MVKYSLPKLYLSNGAEAKRSKVAAVKCDGRWCAMVSDSILA